MPQKKRPRIDVMLSSTSRDLPDHRQQAMNGIMRVGMHPIVMETLTASLGDAISDSLALVDEAEIYIGIFGMRYGYIPDDPLNPDRISITEMEYRHAMERGMPVLIFLMGDDHPPPDKVSDLADFMESSEAGKKKLKALKDELRTEHVVGFFDSAKDLRGQVMQALSDDKVKKAARQIAGFDDEDETGTDTDEPPLPQPPDFYADPPYRLATHFVGRKKELGKLDAWAQSDDTMMLVEAIGGMGKSAVTWEWVQNHAREQLNPEGMMWWSFYESGATMSAFVRYALAYLTCDDPDALKGTPLKELTKRLQTELRRGRFLLVLDGLERVLVAYHRWDAAQMRDDSVEEAESIIKDRDIRTCTDPKDAEVLRALLACEPSKLLISSRLIPVALENRADNLAAGVRHIHLNGLHPDDALALVRAEGVTVRDDRQFKEFMARFGYHSLLVQLVAGRVNKFRRARGDFDAWYKAQGRHLTVASFNIRQQQTHILKYAFEGLEDEQRRFLSQIAAFDDAVSYGTLTVFNPFVKSAPEPVSEPDFWYEDWMIYNADTDEERQHWKDEKEKQRALYEAYLKEKEAYEQYLNSAAYSEALAQFDDLLTELENRGLIRWNRPQKDKEDDKEDTYDMHPVVRGYAFEMLEGDTKAQTFEQIRNYFEQQPDDDIDAAKEVADLSNTIGVYRALLGAGKLDEAAQFFMRRLDTKLDQHIAAYYTVVELLTPLFPDGTDRLPRLRDPSDQSNIINTLAAMFQYVGRNDDALTLKALKIRLELDNDNMPNLTVGLLNYALSLKSDNQLALSQRARERALQLSEAIEHSQYTTMSHLKLLELYKDTGNWQAANDAYAYLQAHPPAISWQADVETYHAETLIYREKDATEALNRAENLANKGKNIYSYRQIQGLRGDVALQTGDYEGAIRYFEDALKLARKHGSAETATYLSCLAHAHTKNGDDGKARKYINDALSQSLREEIHDMYSSIAAAYLALNDRDNARKYALKAYREAWSDGPPFVWWWYLERAKAVLDALDEPYPDMPPYDESNIGKLPYQDEIDELIDKLS